MTEWEIKHSFLAPSYFSFYPKLSVSEKKGTNGGGGGNSGKNVIYFFSYITEYFKIAF